MTSTEEFTGFAAGAAPRLRRTAFLLCGDWHAAEDLTQVTLAKMLSPDGQTLDLVSTVAETVTPLAVATGQAGRSVKVGRRPVALAFTPDGRTAYMVNQDSGTVTPIVVATDRVLPAIKIRGKPDGIAIAPDGRTAYVTSAVAGTDPAGTAIGVITPVDTRPQKAGRATTISGEPVAIVTAP